MEQFDSDLKTFRSLAHSSEVRELNENSLRLELAYKLIGLFYCTVKLPARFLKLIGGLFVYLENNSSNFVINIGICILVLIVLSAIFAFLYSLFLSFIELSPFIIFALVVCGCLICFGIFKANKYLRRAFNIIKKLVSLARELTEEQSVFCNSKKEVFKQLVVQNSSGLNTIDIIQDEFLNKYTPVNARCSEFIEELQLVIECNKTCMVPTAETRINYIEGQLKTLSSERDALKRQFELITEGELKRFNTQKDEISGTNSSLGILIKEAVSTHEEIQKLHNKWCVSYREAASGLFADFNQDRRRLVQLVARAATLQSELKAVGSSLVSLTPKLYDNWEERLLKLEYDYNKLLNYPHFTGAGFFGGRNIEWGEWPRNCFIAGASRAGKSLSMQMLTFPILSAIKNACRSAGDEYHLRSIIFDVDGTTVKQLEAIGFKESEYIVLNPYDRRRWGWATGKDIVSGNDILSLIEVLLPIEDNDQGDSRSYWIPQGRELLQAVIEYLIDEENDDWTLWDVLEISFYDDVRMKEVFIRNPALASSLFLGNSNSPEGLRHYQSVKNTIRSKVRDTEYFAALWNDTECRVSIREFLNSSGVLVIPEDGVTAKDALRKLNSFILQMVGKLAIDGGLLPAIQQPNTWIIVDESTRIAPIPRFDDFLTNGLKRGISVIFGFQSYSIAQKAFGKENIEGIIEQCTMNALLRLDFKSAQWAAEICRSYWGDIESITVGKGESTGTSRQHQRGTSETETEGISQTEGTQKSTTETEGMQKSISQGSQKSISKTLQRGRAATRGSSYSMAKTEGSSESVTSSSSDRYEISYPFFGLFGEERTHSDMTEGTSSTSGSNSSVTASSGGNFSNTRNSSESASHTSGTNVNETIGQNSSSSTTMGTSSSVTTNSSKSSSINRSETTGENESVSANFSIQKNPQKLNRIEASEFAHFPETSPETGLTGVFLMRDLRTRAQAFASRITIKGDVIGDALIPDTEKEEIRNEYRVAPDYDRKLLRKLKNRSSNA